LFFFSLDTGPHALSIKISIRAHFREFAQWRAVPEEDRCPRQHGGGSPRIDVVAQHEEMGALMCYRRQLSVGSTYAAGAAVLMGTLADQTSLPWPGEFSRKIHRLEPSSK